MNVLRCSTIQRVFTRSGKSLTISGVVGVSGVSGVLGFLGGSNFFCDLVFGFLFF